MYENSSYLIDASKVLRGEDTTFDNLWPVIVTDHCEGCGVDGL